MMDSFAVTSVKPKNQKKIVDEASRYDVDIISGGPPCQGFSLAGWFNAHDLRNQLFKEFVSMVAHLSPKIFLLENVMGMLSMDKGTFVEKIISEFESIGYHVNIPWKLNAAEYGVPQRRKRVFIVGTSNKENISPPEKILEEENFVTVKDAIYGLPSLDAGDGEDVIDCKLEAYSEYQRFMMDKVTGDDFLALKASIICK